MSKHSKSPARPVTSAVVFGKENTLLSENANTWNRVNAFVEAYNTNFPSANIRLQSLTPQEHNSRWAILPFTASRLANHGQLEAMLAEKLGDAEVHLSSTMEIVAGGKLATLQNINVDKTTIDRTNAQPPAARSNTWILIFVVLAIVTGLLKSYW